MPMKAALGNMSFAGNVAESLELMRKVWGATGMPSMPAAPGMGLTQSLPSMMMPTLDIDELDKRITDLRAVEQWLSLNMSMLRTSIQTLEVQRNTLATLKSFGAAMLAPMANNQMAKGAGMPPPMPATVTPPRAAAAPEPKPGPAAETPAEATSRKARSKRAEGTGTQANIPSAFDAPLNPAAWWNTLQDQFTRIAATAAGAHTNPQGAGRGSENKSAGATPPRKRRPHKPVESG